ncbi:MAG: hypothetical protein ABJM43_18925 [Paracoccaceae bacterium]
MTKMYKGRQPWLHKVFKLSEGPHEGWGPASTHDRPEFAMWRACTYLPWSWLVLLLSFGICIYSLTLDVWAIRSSVEVNNWFARSGAVLVAASVWVEWNFVASRIDHMPMYLGLNPTVRYRRLVSGFNKLALFGAISGTFVWAYGDILLPYIMDLFDCQLTNCSLKNASLGLTAGISGR